MNSVQESSLFIGDILRTDPCEIHRRLQIDGLIFFQFELSRKSYVDWFKTLFQISSHPDSDSDGITEVSETSRETYHGASGAFSNHSLPLHIDGSAEPVPPPVLSLLIVASAQDGGETLLSDGKTLVRWCQQQPDLRKLLNNTSKAKFRGAHYPLFDPLADLQSITFRFRQDAFLSSTGDISEADIQKVAVQLNRSALTVKLRAGEGYLLHNHRWTHGRNAFAGHRVAWRLLGSMRADDPHSNLNDGFPLPDAGVGI